MNMNEYAKLIDHTKLNQDASAQSIIQLCNEAKEFKFFSVCINPSYIELAKENLKSTNVKICTVIGFPLGQNSMETKVFETIDSIKKGADEIDMVINISKLKEKNFSYCLQEINAVKKACGDKILKVIVETCLLSDEERILACNLVKNSNADFIKTSTGFSIRGATFEDIEIFNSIMLGQKEIKAAGGIKSGNDFLKMISLGATRIGTSKGVMIMNDLQGKTSHHDDSSY